ncbi:MCE family protein [Gordonia sp. NPDC058843]|uniref:MCE family protein n=1 Tax=Gordonia sp. NPDC058843 TaxID=3346648 RepID=UPI0036A2811F
MPPRKVAAIGVGLTVLVVVLALTYDRIPAAFSHDTYRAHFAEVGSLRPGDTVLLSGVEVGKVDDIELDGNRVEVSFSVDSPVELRDATRISIVTTSALGKRALKVTPGGVGILSHDTPIPLSQTTSPYSLTDALDDAGATLDGTDGASVDAALRAAGDVLETSSPSLNGALTGVQRMAETISSRDDQLRTLLTRTRSFTTVLAQRSKQINTLILDANRLLGQLQSRSAELERLIIGTRYLAQQLSALLRENRVDIGPAMAKLRTVLQVLQKNKQAISEAIPGLRNFSMALGESVATGPFFTAFVGNLVPVAYLQPLVDAIVEQSAPTGGR